jgi:hypothetical protein
MQFETVFKLSEDVLRASFRTQEFSHMLQSVAVGNANIKNFANYYHSPGLQCLIPDIEENVKYQDQNGNEVVFLKGQAYYILSFNTDCIYFRMQDNKVIDIVLRKHTYQEETDSASYQWFVFGSVLVPNQHETCEAQLHTLLRNPHSGSDYLDYICQLILLNTHEKALSESDTSGVATAVHNLHFKGYGKIPYTDLTISALGLSDAQAESVVNSIFSTARYLAAQCAMKADDVVTYNEVLSLFSHVFNHRENIIRVLKEKP